MNLNTKYARFKRVMSRSADNKDGISEYELRISDVACVLIHNLFCPNWNVHSTTKELILDVFKHLQNKSVISLVSKFLSDQMEMAVGNTQFFVLPFVGKLT